MVDVLVDIPVTADFVFDVVEMEEIADIDVAEDEEEVVVVFEGGVTPH